MSKVKGQEVVPWSQRLEESAKAAAALERPKNSQISTKSGMLVYNGQSVNGNRLDAVVLGAVFENNMFKHQFDANKPRNPDCYAISTTGEDMRPHPDVAEPQSETCDTCPMQKFELINGRKTRRCKNIRKLALMPADALAKPELIQTAEVATIRVPVTSVKNWKKYVNDVSLMHRRPPFAVVTVVGLRPHQKNNFEMFFETKGLVDDDAGPLVEQRIPAVMESLTAPYEVNQEEPPQPESRKF